jgi:hypothetical protein
MMQSAMLLANQQEVAMLARRSHPSVTMPAGPEPLTIPDPADVSPELRQLLDRQDVLKAKKIELETELQASMEAWRKGERKARVTDILAGHLPKRRIEYRTSQEITDDIADVKSAIDELDARIVQARYVASAAIREMVAPEHRRLIKNMAMAMIEMREAWAAYKDFADKLNAKKIAWSALAPAHPLWLGEPKGIHSPIGSWFIEMQTNGHLDHEDVPEDLRRV